MLTATNRFGLSLAIPSGIKKTIREQSGFGCVICGIGIWEYEHVDPEWINCEFHDPSNMTLLCQECHSKKAKGMISIKAIRDSMLNPFTKRPSFYNKFFNFNTDPLEITFAGHTFHNCKVPIKVDGFPLIEILPPERSGYSIRLSGSFCDSDGGMSLYIIKNEWRAFSEKWHVEVAGHKIIIRGKQGLIHLIIVAAPPNGILIERIRMNYGEWTFDGNIDDLTVNGSILSEISNRNSDTGFSFNTDRDCKVNCVNSRI